MWWYTGSLDGCADIGRVPNPTQHPAAMQCDVTIEQLESQCVNPQYQNVLPGEAANKYVEVTAPITPDDMLSGKHKGVANVCVSVEDEYFGVQCKLRNWHPEVLVTAFQASCMTKRCIGPGSDPCSVLGDEEDTQVCECTLGAQWSLDNPPPDGTAYTCAELDPTTLTPTGRACALQQ